MKKIVRKKHLEMKLQQIPFHPNPKVGFEQYSTPSIIASDLVWNAFSLGDIEDKSIIDLGCGTGMFAIASALMGAISSVGVDIDKESIDLARDTGNNLNITNLQFIVEDISEFSFELNVDTIFQNPPFGSQRKACSGVDLKFVQKAIDLNPEVLYSFHMASTQDFLVKYYEYNDLDITHIFRYNFPIPKLYDFHTKENWGVDVIVIRAILK